MQREVLTRRPLPGELTLCGGGPQCPVCRKAGGHEGDRMKVCVFGAGAIGGHLAVRLARGGADVSVVARGPQLAAIRQDGLKVVTSKGELDARVRASADPAELGQQDAVLVTVKAPALPSVAATIAPLLGPGTKV